MEGALLRIRDVCPERKGRRRPAEDPVGMHQLHAPHDREGSLRRAEALPLVSKGVEPTLRRDNLAVLAEPAPKGDTQAV